MWSISIALNKISQIALKISINDAIDMLIIAYIFYKMLMFIRDTRAEQLFKGVIMLLVATQLSGMLKLHTLYWILVKILEVGFILPFIIFQPELRAGLEHIGRNTSIIKFGGHGDSDIDKDQDLVIAEMVDALYDLASRKIGLLWCLKERLRLMK